MKTPIEIRKENVYSKLPFLAASHNNTSSAVIDLLFSNKAVMVERPEALTPHSHMWTQTPGTIHKAIHCQLNVRKD